MAVHVYVLALTVVDRVQGALNSAFANIHVFECC